MAMAYSDAGANAGADPVATFDADDEVAFMADDTGGAAPSGVGAPAGVVAGSGVKVTVTDPLATRRARSGAAGAGSCTCSSARGPCRRARGWTTSTTTSIPWTRWATPRTRPCRPTGTGPTSRRAGPATASTSAPAPTCSTVTATSSPSGCCGRSEDTFSAGDGGYATNMDGPVRVIRSYLGANSGTYTQREHVFYRRTERVQTFLRVHAIPGIMDFYDYSPAAIGMRYRARSTPAAS